MSLVQIVERRAGVPDPSEAHHQLSDLQCRYRAVRQGLEDGARLSDGQGLSAPRARCGPWHSDAEGTREALIV